MEQNTIYFRTKLDGEIPFIDNTPEQILHITENDAKVITSALSFMWKIHGLLYVNDGQLEIKHQGEITSKELDVGISFCDTIEAVYRKIKDQYQKF